MHLKFVLKKFVLECRLILIQEPIIQYTLYSTYIHIFVYVDHMSNLYFFFLCKQLSYCMMRALMPNKLFYFAENYIQIIYNL